MTGDWKRTKHKKDRRNNNDKQLNDCLDPSRSDVKGHWFYLDDIQLSLVLDTLKGGGQTDITMLNRSKNVNAMLW